MSDYLGNLNLLNGRVLDSTNRNFESVIFQYQKPPLSSEVNLNASIDAVRSQGLAQATSPSGWLSVGQINDSTDASAYQAGDVLCSTALANTFKLVAEDFGQNTGKNIALVNGWKLNVQGSNSPLYATTDENCLVTLPAPPVSGYRIDFVYLEAWRKLITPDENIYKYGNVDYFGGPLENDLIDPARGFETSLRVQIQYRISTASINGFQMYPEGFGPSVNARGPLSSISTCSDSTFVPVPGDLGLWRAGTGDDLSKEKYETVDGFIYAIPMFIIRRRNTHAFAADGHANGAGYSLTDFRNGISSDRPDDFYNDQIAADDIVDLRHRIVSASSLGSICSRAFEDLQANKIKTKMGYSELGEDHAGPVLMNVDYIGQHTETGTWSHMSNWSHPIGHGNNVDGTNMLGRRWFANASGVEISNFKFTTNDKSLGTAGSPWAASDKFTIDLDAMGYPEGALITRLAQNIYIGDLNYYMTIGDEVTVNPAYLGSGVRKVTYTLTGIDFGTGNIIGTSDVISASFDITYPAGLGLTDVPIKFLEVRKADPTLTTPLQLPIAMKDQDIPVRYGSANSAVGTIDGTFTNMLRARGGNNNHSYDFGHQMLYHVRSNGTTSITINRSISGYNILGVADVRVDNHTRGFSTIARTASTYTITLTSAVDIDKDIELTLYTDNKYFEGNKQGRAITACYQMKELIPNEPVDGRSVFTVSLSNTPILGVGSFADRSGYGYAYVDGACKALLNENKTFPGAPEDYLPDTTTGYSFTFATAPLSGSVVEIPVLVRSAIDTTEGYYFFYNTVAYQGRGDSVVSTIQDLGHTWPALNNTWPVTGSIEAVGPAITTSAGSGAITDYTFSQGLIVMTDTEVMSYDDPPVSWTNKVRPGYLISGLVNPTKKYIISSVNDSTLVLASPTNTAEWGTATTSEYIISAPDQPNFSLTNIIDRFPTLNENSDSSGCSNPIKTLVTDGDAVLETRIISKTQDITEARINTLQIGVNDVARGRSEIFIPGAPLGAGTLGLKFESLDSTSYKKTYQSYILNKNNSGQMYLMVAGSETDNKGTDKCFLNAFSKDDAVDIFEIPGRPLIANRTE